MKTVAWRDIGRTAVGTTAGLCVGLALQARPAPAADPMAKTLELETLRVQRIELVDPRGVERGTLAARADGSAYLSFRDPDRQTFTSLGVTPGQGPRLLLSEGDTGLAVMEVRSGGKPVLTLQPAGGRERSLKP